MPLFSFNVALHTRFEIDAKHAEEAEIRIREALHMANRTVIVHAEPESEIWQFRLVGDLVIVDDIKLDREETA